MPIPLKGVLIGKPLTVSALADDGQTCTVDGLAPTATLATVGGNVDGQYNSSGTANCAFNFSNVALADEVNDADSSVQLTVTAADAAELRFGGGDGHGGSSGSCRRHG